MALSKQVTESLVEAQGNIRNALAFASRQERTVTVNAIARILNDIETLQSFDEMLDKLDQEIAET